MAQLVEHPDGCYLGMPHARYLEDWALGYSALKTVNHSPVQWWWKSDFNTIEPPAERTDEEKAHFRLGGAAHVANLEGIDVYEATHGIMPGKEEYPDALVSKDDLIEAAKAYRIPYSGLKKEELGKRLVANRPGIQILDFIQEEWKLDGLRMVTAAEDRRIRLIQKMIMRSPNEFKLPGGEVTTLAGAFTGGLSEVSVFWTDEDGIRQRARFDKLKPRVTVDFKTFASWREDIDFDRGLLREIKQRGYVMQVAHYEEARRQLIKFVKAGQVFGGNDAERAVLKTIAASEVWGFMFVFAVTQGAPMVKGIRFPLGGTTHGEWIQKRTDALARFVHYRSFFGLEPGQMWFDPVAIESPDDDAFAVA